MPHREAGAGVEGAAGRGSAPPRFFLRKESVLMRTRVCSTTMRTQPTHLCASNTHTQVSRRTDPRFVPSPAEPSTSQTASLHHAACVLPTAVSARHAGTPSWASRAPAPPPQGHGSPTSGRSYHGLFNQVPSVGIRVGPPHPGQHWNDCFLRISACLCKWSQSVGQLGQGVRAFTFPLDRHGETIRAWHALAV